MAYRDLRHFLDLLADRRDLARIATEVSQDLEITEFADRAVRRGGPALLFTNVAGGKAPCLINTFGTAARMALALEVPDLASLETRMMEFLALAMKPPGPGLLEKLKVLPKLLDLAHAIPQRVNDGVCKEVIRRDDASLDALPILKCWPQDAGRFITYPLVFTRDPESGARNCGIYRMQVVDGRTTLFHSQRHKDAARHVRVRAQAGERMPAAIALGPDPAVAFAGALPCPPGVDEMAFAGLLRGEPVRMIRAETVDIEVPANAEIVLEGYVDPSDQRPEGPFGDHTGYYSLAEPFPVFHLTAITHRRDPIYQTIVVGPPPKEDDFIGKAVERLFLPLMRLQLPEIVDVNMPFEGIFHNLMLVSIRKQYPGQARKVMHAIWGMGQAMFTKVVVVVDADVNVQDPAEVAWKALNHIDPERDFEFVLGPVDQLDHASRLSCYGSHVGIDATKKTPAEGFTRPWPDEIVMTPQIRALVDGKWDQAGLGQGRPA
ncbi:MAG: menaquinone biosynthesis decarboxylase [Planctomycetes bacterium]|nr:menaquinone biosynthesis decarboxylase [Planctomycetota bacterium]